MLGPTKAFECVHDDDVLIVIPLGDERGLPYSDMQQDSNVIYHLVDRPDVSNIIFDLSSIKMIGSILIGVIFRLARKVESQGGSFICCCAANDVHEALKKVNLLKLWSHYDSREEALDSFSQAVNNPR